MKKLLLLSSLALLAATSAIASDDTPAPTTSTEFDLLEKLLAPLHIARGMTPKDVQARLGAPGAKLAANIWVYWDFKAKNAPRGDKSDTLLVIFSENRVQRIRLCDSQPVRTFLAQQELKATKNAVAAK